MNKTIEHLYVIVILLILSSCMPAPEMAPGAIDGLQYGTTLWVANEALTEQIGSFIMARGEQTMLAAWMPSAKQIGFVLLEGGRTKAVHEAILSGGNVTSYDTFKTFKSAMETDGWAFIKSADVPTAVLLVVDGALAALTQAASWIAYTPVTFIVIPFAEEALPAFMRPEMH